MKMSTIIYRYIVDIFRVFMSGEDHNYNMQQWRVAMYPPPNIKASPQTVIKKTTYSGGVLCTVSRS